MRPPDSFIKQPGELWKLNKPAYGLVESGRLWQLTIEPWMLDEYGLEPVPGIPQIFFKKNSERVPDLVIAKVVDDLLIAGSELEVEQFKKKISKRFQLGRFMTDKSLVFYRIHIKQNENFDIEASMSEYLTTIHPLEISRERRKEHDEKATENELKLLLGLTGKLDFIGHGCLPIAAFAASYLQQKISDLKVSHLREANSVLKEIQQVEPKLLFLSPSSYENARYIGFSDAAQGKTSYGQTGHISGIAFKNPSHHIFHAIDWQSSRQNRLSFSSIGAEILAAAASADRSSLFSEGLNYITKPIISMPLSIVLDSLGSHATITTLHEGKDYRLRPTVARLRDSYESKEIDEIIWIPGQQNIADALTKSNIVIQKTLGKILVEGEFDNSIFWGSKPC